VTGQGGEPEVRPLTPELWPALEDLFADSPVCRRCWCMFPSIGNAYRRRAPASNRADLYAAVTRGPPPGLLAFAGELAVAWCRLTPRDAVAAFDGMWRLGRVDDLPVWSLSCFYVRKGYRRRGLTYRMIVEALRVAKAAGAPALEAYPVDRTRSPSATSTGVVTTFARAGFMEVARRVPARPMLRHDLRRIPS
jgi:GNAT superfamily N-acetyltransferase